MNYIDGDNNIFRREIEMVQRQTGLETEDQKRKKQRELKLNKHKRTNSQIIRDKQRRKELKKKGPRDNEFKKSSYKGTASKYLETSFGFLDDKINTKTSSREFERRKQLNPIQKGQTVSQIGTVKGFKAQWSLRNMDLGNDFLEDNVSSQASQQAFERRKQLVGPIKNATVAEIGSNKHYEQISVDLDELIDHSDFLNDSVNTAASQEAFERRKKAVGPIKKATVAEIGTVKGFKAEWSLRYV